LASQAERARGDTSSYSDLIGIPAALGAVVAILVVFAAFFFIGPVVGVIVTAIVAVLAITILVRWIGANELE
jgi:uncharacterized membrane protein